MRYKVDYEVGDSFSGVLLETFQEININRPRVKTVNMFEEDLKVEFPRKLRVDNPLGSRFRALVKVCQKTYKTTGKNKGGPYLLADKNTITLVEDYSPMIQIYAIPMRDRIYEYVSSTPEIIENPLKVLREKAYNNSIDTVRTYRTIDSGTIVSGRATSTVVRSYAIQRSKGICESCDDEAMEGQIIQIMLLPFVQIVMQERKDQKIQLNLIIKLLIKYQKKKGN